MFIVAGVEGLPIRDPDARYVGSPLALIGVIAAIFLVLDLVPRSWREMRRTRVSYPTATANVFRERWWGTRGALVIVSLLSFYVTYISYRNLKSYLPFVSDANYDQQLLDSERWLLFGNDPATFLHSVLGTGFSAEFLSAIYLGFLTFVPISLAVVLIWSNRVQVGVWYVTALSLCWILGALSYYTLPTLGPAFADPSVFASLPETGVSRLQDTLLEHRNEVLLDPNGTNAVQSIAGFASLHSGVLFAAAFLAHRAGAARWLRYGLWTLLGFTFIATVYFGWHYIVDDIVGVAIGAFSVIAAARMCGIRLSDDEEGDVETDGKGQKEGVDPVEHSSVRSEKPAAVLNSRLALEGGFEEVTGWSRQGDSQAEQRGLARLNPFLRDQDEGDHGGGSAGNSGQQTFDGFVGRDAGGELPAAGDGPHQVGEGVAEEGSQKDRDHHGPAVVERPQQDAVSEAGADPHDGKGARGDEGDASPSG